MATMTRRRVLVAHTGGTIGMARSGDGWAPSPGHLSKLLAEIPELQAPEMPEVTVREVEGLLDSADMSPRHWLRIAREIGRWVDDYDGFVILHGTDTMAYTTSALAFMLEGLSKPVVVTGSQIPLQQTRTDARANLIGALHIAAEFAVPEVCLFFGQRLLRGCRAVKVNAVGFEAFDSPNFPPLGRAGVDIRIEERLVRPAPPEGTRLHVQGFGEPVVGALRLFPGIPAKVLRNILRPPLQGLVLEAFGVGNGPAGDREFIAALEEGARRDVVIVDCSQCLRGRVDLERYATGRKLRDAGVISGFDMTAEAALAKLFYLLSRGLSAKDVRRHMQEDLRGELTP